MSTKLKLNTQQEYAIARSQFKTNPSMLDSITSVIVNSEGELKPDSNPMSKIVYGLLQSSVSPYSVKDEKYYVLRNRPENDLHWNDTNPEWIGKASMSLHHAFIVPGKQLMKNWKLAFNALTFPATQETLDVLTEMKQGAIEYAQKKFTFDDHKNQTSAPQEDQIGLYFHVYPNNSIHHLHMHIVDLRFPGPTLNALEYKNISLDDVIAVLTDEMKDSN